MQAEALLRKQIQETLCKVNGKSQNTIVFHNGREGAQLYLKGGLSR